MKKKFIKKNKNNKRFLIAGGLITALILDQITEAKNITNISNIVFAANDSEEIENNIPAVTTGGIASCNTLFELSDKKKEIITKIAEQYSSLYEISKDNCINIITDNLDFILASSDPVFTISDLIEAYIINNNSQIIENSQNLLGSGTGNIKYINNFKETSNINAYNKYSKMYGVDVNFALALAKQESNLDHTNHLPGGNNYNGYAYGISQIENSLIGSRITVYNFDKNRNETIEIVENYPSNKENGIIYLSILNYEDNVRIGIARLQKQLQKYNYNIAMAMQAYNYGSGTFDKALNAYANETGKSIEDIKNNKTDLGWIKHVIELHNNPQSYGINWNYSTYGDGDYVKHVFQYISEPILKFVIDEDEAALINSYNQMTLIISDNNFEVLSETIESIEDCISFTSANISNPKVKIKK